MIKKILIAIDSSPSALKAAKYGIELAQEVGAEIGIVNVVKFSVVSVDTGLLPVDVEEADVLKAKLYIEQVKKAYPALSIEDFELVNLPHKGISEIITLWEADILVIAHHTHNLLHRILNKDTEKLLLQNSTIPILITPENWTF